MRANTILQKNGKEHLNSYKRCNKTDALASCLIYAWALTAHPTMRMSVVRVRSFIEPDLFDDNVPFDDTTPIYPISLLWKLRSGLWLDLELYYFSIFHRE